MKILIINPPHPSIGSRIPHEHLPPLGLLALGGPLIDDGHTVKLIDAEFGPMSIEEIVTEALRYAPEAVLLGHSGSTSGHPSTASIIRALRQAMPRVWIIYGGVFPTYHWKQIMEQEPALDVIVKGEGEETIVKVASALACAASWVVWEGEDGCAISERTLKTISGIVYRNGGLRDRLEKGSDSDQSTLEIIDNGLAPVVADLDSCRIGWELIDHSRYSYWGDRRAVVVQFSRGCPHFCRYCGQRGFWRTWRHRNPVKFAAELARLHREQGVEVVNFADENPTANREVWRAFLEALIAENVPLILVGSTRAGDIVRDADILHLYKRAGVARFLLGIESTDEQTLKNIQKGSTQSIDREAIYLLRKHGIISMAAWVADFKEAKDLDYWRTLRQIISYDPDQIQALYATPHSWTSYARQESDRRIIQPDLQLWDYKHQVLESPYVPNWRVMVWVKIIEAVAQLRPKSVFRLLANPDPAFRAAMRWYYKIGRKVWPYELFHWLFLDRRIVDGPSLAEFWKTGSTRVQQTAQIPILSRLIASFLQFCPVQTSRNFQRLLAPEP